MKWLRELQRDWISVTHLMWPVDEPEPIDYNTAFVVWYPRHVVEAVARGERGWTR